MSYVNIFVPFAGTWLFEISLNCGQENEEDKKDKTKTGSGVHFNCANIHRIRNKL